MQRFTRDRRAAFAGLFVLLAAAALPGCGNIATNTSNEIVGDAPPEGLVTGEHTTVSVNPSALGMSADTPAPVSTDSLNGAQVTLSGILHSVNSDWIVLDAADSQRWWVRTENLNWIRQRTPPEPQPEPQPGPDAGIPH